MTSFAITPYGQCCRRHVVEKRIVSDSIIEVFVACVLNQTVILRAYCRTWNVYILLHVPNIPSPTTWRRVFGDNG